MTRAARTLAWLDALGLDIAFGVRAQRKTPASTAALVLTLALGIATASVSFAVTNRLFLRPLPVDDPAALVRIYATSSAVVSPHLPASYPDFLDIRDEGSIFSGVVAEQPTPYNLGVPGATERIFGQIVSAGYFSVLGVRPAAGRLFSDVEERVKGTTPVVVISHGLWRRKYGGALEAIPESILLNGHAVRVAGVAPERFFGMTSGLVPDVYVPVALADALYPVVNWLDNRGGRTFFVMARLQPGVTLARARAALDVLSRRLQQQYPGTNRGIRFAVLPEAESRVHPMIQRQAFGASVASLGVAALVLLVACSNVAGVLLVRASARRKEIGVRLALGATRARLVRQLLTEHALLSVAGGVIGLMAAHATARVISAARLPSSVALGLDLDVDGRVLVFVASVTIVTALVFGLAPALDGTKFDLLSLMKDGDHAEAPRQSRLRSLLVSSQVAVAVLLLMACGLFFRNLQHAHRIDIGFTPDAVVMTSMDLGMQNYSAERAREFWSKLNDRLEVLPGVESAGLANQVPFEPRIGAVSLAPEGYTPPGDGSWPLLRYNVAGPRYFSTMRIALVDGREFTDRDDDAAPKVVIVNDVAARQFWADGRAVGRRVTDKSGRLFEVVGIARRGRYLTLGEDPQPYMYFPLGQRDMRDGTIVARGAGDPQALLKQLDSVVHSLDAGLPLYNVKTLSEHVEVALMPAKTGAATLTVVGLVAVLLTSLGLYGTVGYAVSRRTYEIGVRRALGAQDADVARLVVRDAAALVLAGAVCGGLLAIVEARLLQRFLYGANAIDPFAAGLAATVLAIVCIGAAWVPTRRAIRVSAATALRYQ